MTGDRPASRNPAYFSQLYAQNPDPWNFETSDYEHKKYAATIAALGGRRFESGLEIGCSIGVLTRLLAQCCGRLLALDVVEQALRQASDRCASEPHVTFERRTIPEDWPPGKFDLMVFSEVLYFLNPADIRQTARRADASLNPGGVILLVNYTQSISEPCNGEEAADIFTQAASLNFVAKLKQTHSKYRIDLIVKRS